MTVHPTLCVDCVREGRSNPRPKEYNSYCKEHAYARQRKSVRQKSRQKEVIFGLWDLLTPRATSVVVNNLQDYAFLSPPPKAEVLRRHDVARRTRLESESSKARTAFVVWLKELPEQF